MQTANEWKMLIKEAVLLWYKFHQNYTFENLEKHQVMFFQFASLFSLPQTLLLLYPVQLKV